MHARYWLLALIRACVAFVIGALVSLDQDHKAAYGLVMFGLFAVIEGLISAASAFLQADSSVRAVQLVAAVIGVIAGGIALATTGHGLGILLYIVTVWGLLTGAAELYLGIRGRRTQEVARDQMLVGGFTVVLAVVFLLIPADARLAVGLFGAYAAVIGVYLAIGAFSLKWAGAHGAEEASESHA